MPKREEELKYYTDFIKEGELLLLPSKDPYFKSHYSSSPLSVLTKFKGTAGEAIIEKNGKITLFVDTRYHLLAQKQAYKDVEIYKLNLGETFFEGFQKKFPKNSILHVNSNIDLVEYLTYDKYFDLRKYTPEEKKLKNKDIDKNAKIFLANKKIETKDFNYKIKKLKKLNPNCEKMIIFNLDNIAYLTNLRSYQMKYSSLFQAVLYLDLKNSNYILFTKTKPEALIPNLKFEKLSQFKNFIKSQKDEILINPNEVTLEDFLNIKKPKEFLFQNLNLISTIKTTSEIEHLKKANKKIDSTLSAFKKRLKTGLSEYDLANIFEEELISKGGICPSFQTILALDENSASIHYSNYDKKKKIKKENLILLDCGGYFEGGLATDVTRVFYFGKNPKPIYKKIYTAVLKAFIACFNSTSTNSGELDFLAREILKPYEKQGFYFNHGLGHGIGTSVHQNPPRLALASKDTIKPYQVHSIEPGLYGKDEEGNEFGIRIENCVYFDLNYKRHSLTKFEFEDILIDENELNETEKDFIKNWQTSAK